MKATILKAIRKKCLDCSGYNEKEVRECVIPDCSLYPYRMGIDPDKKRQGRIENLVQFKKSPATVG